MTSIWVSHLDLCNQCGSWYKSSASFDKLIVQQKIFHSVLLLSLWIYWWSISCTRLLQKGWFTKFAPSCTQISRDSFFLECMNLLQVLLCFSLCTGRPNIRSTTSLLSVEFFGLQTLQFAAQGDEVDGFALIISRWTVLATRATFGCSFKRTRERMESAGRICPWNDWNLFDWAHKMTIMEQKPQS